MKSQPPVTTVTCLGHGGAFANTDIGNTAYLVERGRHRILIDCGSTVPHVLREMGIDPGTLTAACVTHLHADHVGGLEHLLYYRKFVSNSRRLLIGMGPRTLRNWCKSVQATGTNVDAYTYLLHAPGPSGDSHVLNVSGLGAGPQVTATFIPVSHGDALKSIACYSILLEIGSKRLFFSGDRTWDHQGSDVVFQAMDTADIVFHEIELSPEPSGVHTHISDVGGYASSKRTWWGHHGTAVGPTGLQLTRKGQRWII